MLIEYAGMIRRRMKRGDRREEIYQWGVSFGKHSGQHFENGGLGRFIDSAESLDQPALVHRPNLIQDNLSVLTPEDTGDA